MYHFLKKSDVHYVACVLITFCSLVFAFFASRAEPKRVTEIPEAPAPVSSEAASTPTESPDPAVQIVEMFQEGLRLASEISDDDADHDDKVTFAAAMIENALENFITHPQAASGLWEIQSKHLRKIKEPELRLVHLALFSAYLDRALRNCPDTETMKEIWAVRKEIVGQQTSIQNGLVAAAKSKLSGIASEIKKLEDDLNTEKKWDSEEIYEPVEQQEPGWKDGSYQKILQRMVEVREKLDAPEISNWIDFTENADLPTKLNEMFQETIRLQRLRYNLWANWQIGQARHGNATAGMDSLSKIDTGMLIPVIYSLYSEVEQEKSKDIKNMDLRTQVIKEALLGEKIPLQAF